MVDVAQKENLMKPIPDETQVETLLENLPPVISPRLEKRLASAPWTPRSVKRHRVFTIVYLAIFWLFVFFTLTPQGRAIAQTLLEFFTRTDQQSFPLSEEELVVIYSPVPTYVLSLVEVTPQPSLSNLGGNCSNSETLGTYTCEIQQIEDQLGVDLKEFSSTPASWSFMSIYAPLQNHVLINYQSGGGYLTLSQGTGNFPIDSDWEKVPTPAVQQIKIGEYQGEYVNGSFGLLNGAKEATWESDKGMQRIRWKEGERWFEIFEANGPGVTGYMDQSTLITLATSMVYQPEKLDQIDIDFIPNITLAERVSGFDVKEPTLLPKDIIFDSATYDPERHSVTLIYGYRSLRIVQTPIESALIKNLSSYKNVEIVKVGYANGQFGISPAQKTIWESATPPVFPTDNSYSVLLWQKDDMIYQIYFDHSFSNGGYLTKDDMIRIAESLR
jgi:hypothetical protein